MHGEGRGAGRMVRNRNMSDRLAVLSISRSLEKQYCLAGILEEKSDLVWVFKCALHRLSMSKVLATTGKLGIHGPLPEGNCFCLHHSYPGAWKPSECGHLKVQKGHNG